MNNFKIGDIIVAKDDNYAVTNTLTGWTGIVTEILMKDTDEQLFSAKTIAPESMFGEQYYDLSSNHFDVLCSINRNIVNVGDSVRVKNIDDIAKSADKSSFDDDVYLGHDGIYFNKKMSILCGRECLVNEVVYAGNGVRAYKLTDKLSDTTLRYNYTPWMFTKEEPVDD